MNRIGFWQDIKTANIEYYDIQYATERTKILHYTYFCYLKIQGIYYLHEEYTSVLISFVEKIVYSSLKHPEDKFIQYNIFLKIVKI